MVMEKRTSCLRQTATTAWFVEAAVGAHRELPARSGSAHPAHCLTQEVGGAAGGVRAALAQPRHQHLAAAGRNREQRVIAARARVAGLAGALLGEAVGLAERRVEVDRERRVAGSRPGRPGAGEQLAADAVELADVAPAEAAQEDTEGGRRLDGAAEHARRPAGAQRSGVVDALAARERRGDQGQQLVAGVRPPRRVTEVDATVGELLQTEMLGERGREEQPRIGHQAVVVEGDVYPVGVARC